MVHSNRHNNTSMAAGDHNASLVDASGAVAARSALEPIRERINGIRRIVFVTGAGVSQESGIPTFRGNDGLWRNHDAMKLATIYAFHDNPKLVWRWYNDRRKNIRKAKPNAGHVAVAKLEEYAEVVILTQNIDGLHQRAGSTRVLELHGSITRIKCTSCNFQEDTMAEFDDVPPKCVCGSILRPDVVWFGESLPQDVWQESINLVGKWCDMMVVAGTSLAVSPANILPVYARQNGTMMITVNPDGRTSYLETPAYASLYVCGTSAVVLPEMVSLFKEASVQS